VKALYRYLAENDIDEGLVEHVLPYFRQKKYEKGSALLTMGQNTRMICFIMKGLVRGYFINENGREVTKCFSAEGEWCCIYNMLTEMPSQFWIEALEDCVLAEINVDRLKGLLGQEIKLQTLFTKLFSAAFMDTDEKSTVLQRLPASERYLLFLEKYPKLRERVKQEDIASYIGITPASLSRIKRSL